MSGDRWLLVIVLATLALMLATVCILERG